MRLINKKRTDIGIIVSVSAEAGMLCRDLRGKTGVTGHYFKGSLSGKRIVLMISGMGKVNAAHAATSLIHEFSPAVVMNIGIGGAYPSSGMKTGDVAIAEKEIYGDEGVLLKDGFHGIDLIGIPLVKKGRKNYFNEFLIDRKLAIKAVKAAQLITHHSSRITVKKGTFLTLSTCTGTKKRALELERRFSAICENMEGAAIAHICTLYDVPMIEMRGISNMAGVRDRAAWHVPLAAENCQKAALEYIKTL
ncbi:MAG: futalosine hydrolase [Nitrospirae bacterium]|nr:futalosine hydrolase [Nitrospirota bacterium]